MPGIGLPEVFVLVFLVFMCIPGVIGAVIAANKGRSKAGWFVLCALFWGIPILVLLFLPPGKEVPGRYRQCSACKEFIKWNATLCKHCKTVLAPQ
jgi:hypothetical protein